MTDYSIQANTRRCAATGRELLPGEKVYSVLVDEQGKFLRRDYSAEAWSGPPPEAFSFWAGRVPQAEQTRRLRIDDELLLDCFHRLEGQNDPERQSFRYVLALLLMRRKRFKFEEARLEGEQEVLCLRCLKSRSLHEVVNPRLSADEMEAVQQEIFRVLGWE
jgi:hypothetical protein